MKKKKSLSASCIIHAYLLMQQNVTTKKSLGLSQYSHMLSWPPESGQEVCVQDCLRSGKNAKAQC